jgi:multidrug efflux pump subunit AcrA (membrane-fusion protein)
VRALLRGFVMLADAAYGAFWTVDRDSGTSSLAAELMLHVPDERARAWGPAIGKTAAEVIEQRSIRYDPIGEPAEGLLTGREYMAVGFPVEGYEIAGCVVVVVRAQSPVLSDTRIAMLKVLADYGLLYSSTKSAARFEKSYKSLSGAWDVVGETLAFARPVEMAQVMVDRSRRLCAADRVSLGLIKGSKVSLAAISGEDILDRRSNVVRLIRATQMEVLMSGEPGIYTASADVEERTRQLTRNPQHERLAREVGTDAVYSVPLRNHGDVVGVLTFEFGGSSPTLEIRQVIDVMAGHVGPLLHLSRQNDRGTVARSRDGLMAGLRYLSGGDRPWRKVALLATVALVGTAIFGKKDFNVTGNCTLAPSFRRIYCAPFDTTIRSAPVRPGDTVEVGQTLVEFDREDLELRLREVRSSRNSLDRQMATYLAQQKMPQYAEARARWQASAAEIELLERHIARSEHQAEFAGIVLLGDLRQDIGRPVRMGERLIEVAPLDELLIEVEVDQGDVGLVNAGQWGHFTTRARPNVSIPFTVDKLRPAPEVRGGASIYIAEATVPNVDGWLRPGMEGVAKVRVDRRNVTWVVSRKLVNWVRLHLWW